MDESTEIVLDFHHLFRFYKDGRFERFTETTTVPPSDDPLTGVHSKDIPISPENNNVSARLYLPKTAHPNRKLPLLIYIHGGAFVLESASSAHYHTYLNTLAAEANLIAVSVEYRLAPEHQIPACYEDSWSVLQWVAQHAHGDGSDPWLNDHADFDRVYVAGDSAGANISHNLAVRAGTEGVNSGVKIVGVVLVHPYLGKDENDVYWSLWKCICPVTSGMDDRRFNPTVHPDVLASLGCSKVLVCVAEKEDLRDRGWGYYEALKKSDWSGSVEIVETKGEDHLFHLIDPSSLNAADLMKKVVNFITQS